MVVLPSGYQPTLYQRLHHNDGWIPSCSSLSTGRSVWQVSCSSAPPPCGPRRKSSGCHQCRLHLKKKGKKREDNLQDRLYQRFWMFQTIFLGSNHPLLFSQGVALGIAMSDGISNLPDIYIVYDKTPTKCIQDGRFIMLN